MGVGRCKYWILPDGPCLSCDKAGAIIGRLIVSLVDIDPFYSDRSSAGPGHCFIPMSFGPQLLGIEVLQLKLPGGPQKIAIQRLPAYGLKEFKSI